MTEAKWLACTETAPLLEFLGREASQRKLLLFACACCRGVWSLLLDPRSREALETMESLADGEANLKEARAAYRLSLRAWRWASSLGWPFLQAAHAVRSLTAINSLNPPENVARYARGIADGESMEAALRIAQVALLHDIFGNPYRPVRIPAAWLQWYEGTIPKLAKTIYDERAFDRLPILADALEEAGCTDADILNHCRQPGEHVRGCWVIDLLLGKS